MAAKKKKKKEVVVEEPKYLSELEIVSLEKRSLSIELAEALVKVEIRDRQILLLRADILKLKAESGVLGNLKTTLTSKKIAYKSKVTDLKDRYSLNDGWGYDPISGEIKE